MLKAIKLFFEENMSMDHHPKSTPQNQTHSLHLATAALLVEMMHQDDAILEVEKQAILDALGDNFELNSEESSTLLALAEDEVKQATDYYQFTQLITEHFTQQQKIQVIELLWRVAYADGHLDSYEEHMVRRIADLISVPHQDFIRTKLNVQQ